MDTTDLAYEAHQAAEKHLDDCWAALDAEQEGEENPPWPDRLAGPFCGCQTCEVRETLAAAWPLLVKAAKEEAAAQA